MVKQRKGKLRPVFTLLTFVPLVILSIVIATTMRVEAMALPTIPAVEVIALVDYAPLQKLAGKFALQTPVTPTVSATPTRSSLVLPRLTPTVTATLTAISIVSPTTASESTALSNTISVSGTVAVTTSLPTTVTAGVTATEAITAGANVSPQVLDAEYAGPIEGTIIANRTEANVRFFVEGATYELAPLRSIGLTLPRVTAVLNLFNCDATLPETQAGCFWDPYLLDRDSFYEVVSGEESGSVAALTLQTAGTPPSNQVWLQNRTGKREQIFYAGETYELPPSTVQEFTTAADTPAIFYLRSCLEVADRTVCEWSPNDANPGFYYALVEVNDNGAVPDSQVNALQLQAIVSSEGAPPGDITTPDAPLQVVCHVQVPALNVRSGPGLQYQIISKVRSSEQAPATVLIIGRDAGGEWLAVDDEVAPGGWVTGSSGFVTCQGDVSVLPVAEVTDGSLVPTPVAAAPSAPVENNTATGGDQEPVAEASPAVETPSAPQTAPPGQALLVVHNGFEQQVRFTMDQRYRVEIGASEFDLQPGQSVNILVYPGMITFSASTPWRGLSGNDDIIIDAEQTRDLWITFVPDPDGSGRWLLQF